MTAHDDWLSDVAGRRIPHGSWPPARTAPPALELVRQLLNTRNPQTGADILGTAGELRAWMDERQVGHGRVGRAELTEVHAEPAGDTVLEGFDRRAWREIFREEHEADERHAAPFSFVTLARDRRAD